MNKCGEGDDKYTPVFIDDNFPQFGRVNTNLIGAKQIGDSQPSVGLVYKPSTMDHKLDYGVFEPGKDAGCKIVLEQNIPVGPQSLCAGAEFQTSGNSAMVGLDEKAKFEFDDGQYGDLVGQPAPPSGGF